MGDGGDPKKGLGSETASKERLYSQQKPKK